MGEIKPKRKKTEEKNSGMNRKEQLIERWLYYVYACTVYILCSTSLKHKQIVNRPIGLLILHAFNKSETEWVKHKADRTG